MHDKSSIIANENMKNTDSDMRSKSNLPVLIIVMMTSFLTTFSGSALNLSITDISTDFNVGAVSVGWIMTGYILSTAVFAVPFGRFADLYSKRKVLHTGQVIFTATLFLCTISWNIGSLILFRVVMGIGAAMIFSTNLAILVSVYPPMKRGQVLGISVSSTYFGLSLGPVLGGILNYNVGWRSIFAVTAILATLTLILSLIYLKDVEKRAEIILEKFGDKKPQTNLTVDNTAHSGKEIFLGSMDIPGCIIYVVMLALIMYGLTSLMSNIISKIFLPIGIILLIIFVKYENSIKNPVLKISLFSKNVTFAFSNIAALLNYGASYAVSYLLSIYLQTVVGLNSQIAGIILITSPVFQTILSPLAGKLSDRISPYILASCGMALSTAGIISFIFLKEDTALAVIIAALVVIGIGFALFSSPNTNSIMSSVGPEDLSIATSVNSTSRTIGQTLGMAVVSIVTAVTVGNVTLTSAPTQAILEAITTSFIVFTILGLAAVYFSAKRK